MRQGPPTNMMTQMAWPPFLEVLLCIQVEISQFLLYFYVEADPEFKLDWFNILSSYRFNYTLQFWV